MIELMSTNFQSVLAHDPISPLLASKNQAIILFTERDLLGNSSSDVQELWELREAKNIVRKQRNDGSWQYPGGNNKLRSAENYDQLETFRKLGYMIELYGFNQQSPAVAKAVNFLFSFQTEAGDIRGILGNQYTPYYTAAILELIIKAGYSDDPRVIKAFKWLSDIRQNDGGWAIPLRTRGQKLDVISMKLDAVEPDRVKPFSHMVTGVVLRAYAAHKTYRQYPEAKEAGQLLLTSLFKADHYPDRSTSDFWLKFTFPFWFTDLISAMDSLTLLGFSRDEPQMQKALDWLIENQAADGLWHLKTLKNPSIKPDLWLSLAICRILKRLY